MKNNEIKRSENYLLEDIRHMNLTGNYRIVKTSEDFPDGQAVGVYYKVAVALEAFTKLLGERNDRL